MVYFDIHGCSILNVFEGDKIKNTVYYFLIQKNLFLQIINYTTGVVRIQVTCMYYPVCTHHENYSK